MALALLLLLFSPEHATAAVSCQDACNAAILLGGMPACYCNPLCVVNKPGKCCDDFQAKCPNEYASGMEVAAQGSAVTKDVPLPPLPAGCVVPEGFIIPIPEDTFDWVASGKTCKGHCNSGMTKDGKRQPFCFCDSGCLLTSDCCADFGEHCDIDPCVMAMVAPQTVAPDILPNGQIPGSCKGSCGQIVPGRFMQGACSCEAACVEKRNCCDDFTDVCPQDPALKPFEPVASPKSCFGMCGKGTGQCWCDYQCIKNGDCCDDYLLMCGAHFSMHAWRGYGSCYKNCGGAGNDCWCDATCVLAEDCCSDYLEKCGKTS